MLNTAQNPRRRLSHRLESGRPLVDSAAHIPQRIPIDLYNKHLREALQLRGETGRTFASLCLARSLPQVANWAEAAQVLGVPNEVGTRTPALASAGLLTSIDELLQRIQRVSDALIAVDYRESEARVRRLLTHTDWFDSWRQCRPRTRPQSIRYAITWLWEHHACGHPDTNPAHLEDAPSRATYRAFAAGLNPVQQHVLQGACA